MRHRLLLTKFEAQASPNRAGSVRGSGELSDMQIGIATSVDGKGVRNVKISPHKLLWCVFCDDSRRLGWVSDIASCSVFKMARNGIVCFLIKFELLRYIK